MQQGIPFKAVELKILPLPAYCAHLLLELQRRHQAAASMRTDSVSGKASCPSNRNYGVGQRDAMLALLRAERERRGLLQAELSESLGRPQSYISKIERGERRMDVIELRRVCHAMDVDFRQFIDQLERELA